MLLKIVIISIFICFSSFLIFLVIFSNNSKTLIIENENETINEQTEDNKQKQDEKTTPVSTIKNDDQPNEPEGSSIPSTILDQQTTICSTVNRNTTKTPKSDKQEEYDNKSSTQPSTTKKFNNQTNEIEEKNTDNTTLNDQPLTSTSSTVSSDKGDKQEEMVKLPAILNWKLHKNNVK